MQIQWDEITKTGYDKLDEQHKRLVLFYNQFDQAMKEKRWQDVRKIKSEVLKEMIEYVDYHFNYEEELMRGIGYEGVEKSAMGAIQSILVKNGTMYGGADPRRSTSLAAGY